jgi:hypothetical protein
MLIASLNNQLKKEHDEIVRTGFIWLRIGTSGGLFETR